MQNKNKLSPFFLLLKIPIFTFLIFVASNAYAEYYMVYPTPGPYFAECYRNCPDTCVHYLHFSSPHRRNHLSSSQMEEYEWVGDP